MEYRGLLHVAMFQVSGEFIIGGSKLVTWDLACSPFRGMGVLLSKQNVPICFIAYFAGLLGKQFYKDVQGEFKGR
jgi:hypothetical protein